MADESQYSSGLDSAGSHKRKYEDPPAPRRPTGFSSPPDSAARSYNSVPPPLEGIEMAKAKAQEIAARLAATAAAVAEADNKRLRVENGSSGFDSDKGFSSAPPEMKLLSSSVSSAVSGSYGNYHGTSKTIDIPQNRVGVIIGKGGETIKYLQLQSGAKIQVQRDTDADRGAVNRPVELVGTPEQVAKAEQLINDVLSEAESGGSNTVSRRFTGDTGGEHFEMRVPNNKVGLVIGKGGETIKSMQARTGARIQVIPLHLPPGDPATERTVHIDGTSEQIKIARELVEEVISENRPRNPSMTGGYCQQGYQARPQSSWGPPGAPAMQQPGYGYMQSGGYPGPSPQYSQPPYGAYPGQPTSAGYGTGWDQPGVPPNQQSAAGGGYDYYNQPQQQTTPGGSSTATDNSGYSHNQPPASGYAQQGQGYYQDGYGGYPPQSGYGQPPAYDQQAYGAAAGCGTSSTQEGQNPSYAAQSDSSAQSGTYPQGTFQPGYANPAASQTAYGSQPPAQPGFGSNDAPPQGQKPPPAYGQTQQSPSTPGSYGQPAPAQPGYPSGYSQPDSGAPRAPPSYGAAPAQAGYPPSYGAPPASQPGYGTEYNAYGGNYAQPPAYSADGSTGSANHGAYDSAPASQSVPPTGVAKTSPQS